MSAKLIKSKATQTLSYVPYAIPAGTATAPAPQPTKPRMAPPGAQGGAAVAARLQTEGAGTRPEEGPTNSNASETAHEIIKAAQAEAERVLAAARNSAAQIEREARERGIAEGRAVATAEAVEAARPLREQLARTIDEISGLREEIVARTERDLVRLALEIAKRVVHREVTVDPEIVLTLARVALTRLHHRSVATVRLHPEDFGYVTTRREQLEASGAIEIVEDRSIPQGGCLVQTEMGDIDARIEQQFAEIERGFLDS